MKPILFNTEMVQAILEGRKTVTRRVIKPIMSEGYKCLADESNLIYAKFRNAAGEYLLAKKPYMAPRVTIGKDGDILYVRETGLIQSMKNFEKKVKILFKADTKLVEFSVSDKEYNRLLKYEYPKNKWLSPYWLTKETARIFLKVKDIRVEKLQDITEEQAINEGVKLPSPKANYINSFIPLWDSTIKEKELDKYGWDANPWVWVIEFEKFDS